MAAESEDWLELRSVATVSDEFDVVPIDGSKQPGLVDAWGAFSAKEQGLAAPATTSASLRPTAPASERVYLVRPHAKREDGPGGAVGMLKTGNRHLFLRRANGAFVEADPRCVLDICIHPSLQRRGLGLGLIRAALAHEGSGATAETVAYDRPSAPMQALLATKMPEAFGSVVEQDCRFWVSPAVVEALAVSR